LLHVSALVGHLQAEYTIISGNYFTYNGCDVFVIRSYLLLSLVSTTEELLDKKAGAPV
jgi:hypothetical protein